MYLPKTMTYLFNREDAKRPSVDISLEYWNYNINSLFGDRNRYIRSFWGPM